MSRDKIEKWDEVNGITAPERSLEAFLESSTDTYAILQLRDSDDTRYERFMSYNALQRHAKESKGLQPPERTMTTPQPTERGRE